VLEKYVTLPFFFLDNLGHSAFSFRTLVNAEFWSATHLFGCLFPTLTAPQEIDGLTRLLLNLFFPFRRVRLVGLASFCEAFGKGELSH